MDAQGEGLTQAGFTVPSLRSERDAVDVRNSVNSLSGVEYVDVNMSGHTVSVTYDTAYIDKASLKEFIQRTGYPVEG